MTRLTNVTGEHCCRDLDPAGQSAPAAASARPAVPRPRPRVSRASHARQASDTQARTAGDPHRHEAVRPHRRVVRRGRLHHRLLRRGHHPRHPGRAPGPRPPALACPSAPARARPRLPALTCAPPAPDAPPCAAPPAPRAGPPHPRPAAGGAPSGRRRAGYSIWTGYSFKAPLLASAVACLVGNLAYSFSYDARALWLLVLARLVTGLGARPAAGLHHAGLRLRRQPMSVPVRLDQARPACGRAQRAAGRLKRARALQSLCVCGGVVLVGHGVAGAARAPGAAEHCPPAPMRARAAPGSARAVNRSYIALFVPRAERTSASALFVSLSAVGMALGPLLALPLSHFPDLTAFGLTFNKARPLRAAPARATALGGSARPGRCLACVLVLCPAHLG